MIYVLVRVHHHDLCFVRGHHHDLCFGNNTP